MRLREIKPGMVIHCNDKNEKKVLFEELKRLGYVWCGNSEIDANYDCEVCNDTIYVHSEVEAYQYKNITHGNGKGNIEFSDLIIPELSAAEVPAILYEICEEYSSGGVNCNPDCPFAFHGMKCDQYKAENGQRVVEACEQWKADHEKKEPEFEWVDICRIIEVQDNGKKVCVHEEDIKDADLPFGYKECTAELILKEYMKSHDGNYFATVERVCRVKGEK